MLSENNIDMGAASAVDTCPVHTATVQPTGLRRDEALVLAQHKRMVVHRTTGESGTPELNLYYGEKVISFDEPHLFAFGETLATQSRFIAADATQWSGGYRWSEVAPLLEQLLDDGILVRASEIEDATPARGSMVRPNPLPASVCPHARTWSECESLTRELTGRAVEPGYLELVVPVFRIAHLALDRDGRQVGEANVFPRALRLDNPTDWVACAYEGSRHMSERPMNVTALKAMRLHWRQMMAVLSTVRAAYLQRFPDTGDGWTIARAERLAALVLAVPTWQLVKADAPVANGELHPVLSSVFRVTDGLRMTLHQMLFVPIGEPARRTNERVTTEELFEYAERNYSFHSETGVCAGPKHMILEFMRVLLDGEGAEANARFPFDPAVADALADMDAAFDYGLAGLQAHFAFFSLWPAMARAYAQLTLITDVAVEDGAVGFTALRDRMRTRMQTIAFGTYHATEEWRANREQAYVDLFDGCRRGLSTPYAGPGLQTLLASPGTDDRAAFETSLDTLLADRLGASATDRPHVEALRLTLMAFVERAQAIFRAASAAQATVNALVGRPAPARAFGSFEADVTNILQGAAVRRLPCLFDELAEALDIAIVVDTRHMAVVDRRNSASTHQP